MSDDAAPLLICVTTALAHDSSIVDGSIVGWCTLCAEELWISPTGQAMIDEIGAQPHCWVCANGIMQTQEETSFMPLTTAQREEIKQHIQKQVT